jgi:hypothetical protein
MVLGGYTGAGSLDTILAGPPSHLRIVGRLPRRHTMRRRPPSAARSILFGGGESVSMPSVVRVDPRGAAAETPALGEPLSDLGAVAIGGQAYLVGGLHRDAVRKSRSSATPAGGSRHRRPAYRPARAMRVSRRWPDDHTSRAGLTTAGATSAGLRRLARRHRPARGDSAGRRRITLRSPQSEARSTWWAGGDACSRSTPVPGRWTVAARLPALLSDPTATTVGNRIVSPGAGQTASGLAGGARSSYRRPP